MCVQRVVWVPAGEQQITSPERSQARCEPPSAEFSRHRISFKKKIIKNRTAQDSFKEMWRAITACSTILIIPYLRKLTSTSTPLMSSRRIVLCKAENVWWEDESPKTRWLERLAIESGRTCTLGVNKLSDDEKRHLRRLRMERPVPRIYF